MVQEFLQAAMLQIGISALQPYQTLCLFHILNAAGLTTQGHPADTAGNLDKDATQNDSYEEPRKRLVVLPTGYGKTICFVLPALILPKPTLVIYPLRALMADQARRFASMSIPCVVLEGGLEANDRQARLDSIKSGRVRLILANPEILLTNRVREVILGMEFSHVVLDEAHVIELWGSTFRPAYAELRNLLAVVKADQTTALTATADATVSRGIRAFLGDSALYELAAPVDRPEIRYHVIPTTRPAISIVTLLLGSKHFDAVARPCIVFVRNRASCEWLTLRLSHARGLGTVRFYHAGLSSAEKHHIEHWFFHAADGVLVSTNAYGMGVDKNDIRTVIHVGLPDSAAAYLQESGRAGRDKKKADAIVLHRVARYSKKEPASTAGFPDSITDDNRCRRSSLLRAMECDMVDCMGCDVCDGKVQRYPPEVSDILRFVNKHRALLNAEELPGELRSSGYLRSFNSNQIRQVVHDCIASKILRISHSPLSWKRVTT